MKKKILGMRHIALLVNNLEDCVKFYAELLDMKIVWQPDADNVYLSSGSDNLALHRAPHEFKPEESAQRLDHIGFALETPEEVDLWHDFLQSNLIRIVAKPKTHRDSARSFYCKDPAGTLIQFIYHPSMQN